jgi:hypothetical protein
MHSSEGENYLRLDIYQSATFHAFAAVCHRSRGHSGDTLACISASSWGLLMVALADKVKGIAWLTPLTTLSYNPQLCTMISSLCHAVYKRYVRAPEFVKIPTNQKHFVPQGVLVHCKRMSVSTQLLLRCGCLWLVIFLSKGGGLP